MICCKCYKHEFYQESPQRLPDTISNFTVETWIHLKIDDFHDSKRNKVGIFRPIKMMCFICNEVHGSKVKRKFKIPIAFDWKVYKCFGKSRLADICELSGNMQNYTRQWTKNVISCSSITEFKSFSFNTIRFVCVFMQWMRRRKINSRIFHDIEATAKNVHTLHIKSLYFIKWKKKKMRKKKGKFSSKLVFAIDAKRFSKWPIQLLEFCHFVKS